MNNFFQTENCYEFYKSVPSFEAFKVEVKRGNDVKGRIVGYIQKDGDKIKQFFSRRAIINGGPMLADDITEEEISTLLNACKKQLKRKSIYIETRNFNDYSKYKDSFQKCGWKYEPHFNFHIDTTSVEMMESNLGKSRKRDIRTSIRDGAIFGEAESLNEVYELYLLLENLYRTKVKTPLFPYKFFEELYLSKWGKIFVVRLDNIIVGGTVCACDDNTVYEWFACGMDGISKSVFPSTLATYAGIKYAAGNSYSRFDMMGAGSPGDKGYGVRDFKAKFGGELVEHGRFKCILNFPLYYFGTLAIKIIKKI